MVIKTAEFVKSSARADQCPSASYPEYAFAGRSNVGKSSLINYLTDFKNLAKTSSTPGKTRLINHFLINGVWYLVDLPGYGYAKVPKGLRKEISQLINKYLENRHNLACLFLLIDSRHAPIESDLLFMRQLGINQVPFVIVFTKCDKLSAGQLDSNLNSYLKRLGKDWETLPRYFITSSSRRQGKDEILGFIESTNEKLSDLNSSV